MTLGRHGVLGVSFVHFVDLCRFGPCYSIYLLDLMI